MVKIVDVTQKATSVQRFFPFAIKEGLDAILERDHSLSRIPHFFSSFFSDYRQDAIFIVSISIFYVLQNDRNIHKRL